MAVGKSFLKNNGKEVLAVDLEYFRPTEVDILIGDPSKSLKLGWEPQYDLASLVKEMVASDLNILKRLR